MNETKQKQTKEKKQQKSTTKSKSKMKKYLMIFALTMGIAGAANAQVADSSAVVNNNVAEELTLTKVVYPQQEEDGDRYHGLSRKLTLTV
ncbi:hypothetical protein SFC43_05540 [Bacteroides sp. CR5/BHMF/2]|nr:hypothetical protein [Bacteroides sp. CR5/BHMF/2]